MSVQRHVWRRIDSSRGYPTWVCRDCLMRRRWKDGKRWEYLPRNSSGWEHAQRTCGPCPGEEPEHAESEHDQEHIAGGVK